MKQLIGGIAGALITGVAILGWNGPTARTEAVWAGAQAPAPVQLVADSNLTPASVMDSESARSALNVTCEPGQRAVVRHTPAPTGTTIDAGCVSDDVASLSGVRTFAPMQPMEGVRAVPVSYSSPRLTPIRSVRNDDYVPSRRVEPRRSWKKRALVIGGSAGAGAGVGAIAGGKKGALIGAAIGGGAGTLYEIVKH
jgi:hypothetical protein